MAEVVSAVKAGDRVRLTCGESVVVGVVKQVDETEIKVTPDGCTRFNFFDVEGWAVEVLPPPIPDVVDTIIRDGDGDAWQRRGEGWYLADYLDDYKTPRGIEVLQRDYGPLVVLWMPEVKS